MARKNRKFGMLMLRVSMAPGMAPRCGLIRAKGPAVFLAQPEGLGTAIQLGAMVHACVTMLIHTSEPNGKEEPQIRHAHASREHGTRN